MTTNYYYTQPYMMQFFRMQHPFNQGKITTPDGNTIAFMEYGHPLGAPVVSLHGGPGGRSQLIDLAFFDLTKQRVILYDQRHCGFSQTSQSNNPASWQNNNTTQDLINDLEYLRLHLKINQWSLFGGSWGSCLGLCYAIQNPDKVIKQVYWGILLGRQSCIDYVTPESLSPMEAFYCDNNFFIPENYILANINRIKHIPTKIVHGEKDPVCSAANAHELITHFDNNTLIIAPEEGHHPYMPEMFKNLSKFAKEL